MAVAGGFDNELYGKPSPSIHPSSDSFSGNALIIRDPAAGGIIISGAPAYAVPSFGKKLSAGNFERYDFVLGADSAGRDTPMIKSGGYVAFGDGLTGGNRESTVTMNFLGGGRIQGIGEEYYLIDASVANAGLIGGLAGGGGTIYGRKGATLLYGYELYDQLNTPYVSETSNNLYAKVSSVGAHPQAKALSEGRVGGMDLVAQAADASIGAISSAKTRSAADERGGGFYPFGTFGYVKSRLDSGSHVDSEGVAMLMGLAKTKETSSKDGSRLTFGGFVEAGLGNYDSYNSFANFSDAHGSGDTNYYGLYGQTRGFLGEA
jgi:hypothetical protein